MKALFLSLVLPAFSGSALAQAAAPATEPPVPVAQAWPAAPLQAGAPAEQRLYGALATPLIDPAAAQAVVDKFRAVYGTVSAPRLVIYVNRSLIDPAGLTLTARTESYTKKSADGKTTSSKTKAASSYAAREGVTTTTTLADQQTVRDIERLVGRAFRNGGAKLADQRTAAVMLSAQPSAPLLGDQASKERDALAQAADLAIEVLISTRTLIAAEISGDTTVAVPDIQMTAIRLKDAAILGQASASDVLGLVAGAAQAAKKFSAADITEATTLALMEDMLLGAK